MIGPDDDLKKKQNFSDLVRTLFGWGNNENELSPLCNHSHRSFCKLLVPTLPPTESSRSKGQKLTYGVSCWVGKTANLRAKPPATQLASLNSNYANSAPHPVQVLMRRDGKCAKAFQDCSCEHGVSAEASIPHSSSTHSALLVLACLEGTS